MVVVDAQEKGVERREMVNGQTIVVRGKNNVRIVLEHNC